MDAQSIIKSRSQIRRVMRVPNSTSTISNYHEAESFDNPLSALNKNHYINQGSYEINQAIYQNPESNL